MWNSAMETISRRAGSAFLDNQERLESDHGDLARAKQRWEEAKAHQQDQRSQVEQQQSVLQDTRRNLEDAKDRQDKALRDAAAGLDDLVRGRLRARTGEIQLDELDTAVELEQKHRDDLETEKNRAMEEKNSSSTREIINTVLRRTEFKAGSYLRLCARTDQYPHVRDFTQKLKRLFSLAGSEDHEARFAQLQQVIQILDKASNPASAGTLESLRLLDPRHQMSFYAIAPYFSTKLSPTPPRLSVGGCCEYFASCTFTST